MPCRSPNRDRRSVCVARPGRRATGHAGVWSRCTRDVYCWRMGVMVRKQVYIDAGQEQFLKRRAADLGVTEAELNSSGHQFARPDANPRAVRPGRLGRRGGCARVARSRQSCPRRVLALSPQRGLRGASWPPSWLTQMFSLTHTTCVIQLDNHVQLSVYARWRSLGRVRSARKCWVSSSGSPRGGWTRRSPLLRLNEV